MTNAGRTTTRSAHRHPGEGPLPARGRRDAVQFRQTRRAANDSPGLGHASPTRRVSHPGCTVDESYGGSSRRERRAARVPEDGPRSSCEGLLPPRLGGLPGSKDRRRRDPVPPTRCQPASVSSGGRHRVCGRQRDGPARSSVRVTVRFLRLDSCNPMHSRRGGRYTKETRKA